MFEYERDGLLEKRKKVVKQIALLSLVVNILLTISKLFVGIVGHSSALFADGIHSLSDVFASLLVYLVVGFANKPADKEHPYGHGRAEVVISGLVGVILFIVSVYIVIESAISFLHPIETPKLLGFWIALASCIIKVVLYKVSLNVAQKQDSKAIEAIAYDHKSDILASLFAAIGIVLVYIGVKQEITVLLYADKVASVLVAYLIFNISKEMMIEAFHILIDRSVDEKLMKKYHDIIHTFKEVKRIDKIRAREHGHYVLIDLRISIPHDYSIKQGHDLCREIKQAIKEKYDDVHEVLIHLNPYFEED